MKYGIKFVRRLYIYIYICTRIYILGQPATRVTLVSDSSIGGCVVYIYMSMFANSRSSALAASTRIGKHTR